MLASFWLLLLVMSVFGVGWSVASYRRMPDPEPRWDRPEMEPMGLAWRERQWAKEILL